MGGFVSIEAAGKDVIQWPAEAELASFTRWAALIHNIDTRWPSWRGRRGAKSKNALVFHGKPEVSNLLIVLADLGLGNPD